MKKVSIDDKGKKIVLFGAGQIGRAALAYFNVGNVAYFVDNNQSNVGRSINGIPIISFEQLKEVYADYEIVISTGVAAALEINAQMKEAGIDSYKIFLKMKAEEKERLIEAVDAVPKKISVEPIEGKKRVLMFTYWFPPLSGSGVFRSLKFVKYLPAFNWMPTVISTDCPPPEMFYVDESLICEVPKDVDVIRIPDFVGTMRKISFSPEEEEKILLFLKNILQENEDAFTLFESLSQTRTGRAKLLTFPCFSLVWAYDVIQYVEKNIDLSKFQMVYTSSAPHSIHLIGCYLKEKYDIPWVADYRDPWTGNALLPPDLTTHRGKLLTLLESVLLKRADCNITVEEELIQDYLDRFSLAPEKIVSITNGYDEDDYSGLQVSKERTEFFTINYCGMMYGNEKIDSVLEALRQLVNEGKIDQGSVRVRIVGASVQYDPKAAAKKYGFEANIVETGYVSHKEAIQSNLDANLLLLLTGNAENSKADGVSKLYDYLRSGRPILAFAAKDGVVDQLLQATGHGKTCQSTQIAEVKLVILQEYQKWACGEDQELLYSPLIEHFERKNLTKKLAELFNLMAHEKN